MAYCGKLGGIDGTVSVANVISSAFNVTTGKITHGVDNQVVLTNCFGPDEPDTTTPGFNLVKKIRASIRLSGIKWVGKKVKAHQDDDQEYDTLDPWAKANIKADKIAKDYLQEILTKEPITYKPTQHDGCNVTLNDKVITRKFETNIILHCTEHNIQQYWLRRFSIPAESATDIDWTTFQKTRKYLAPHQQLFILKHTAGISATGRNMVRRQKRDCDKCP